MSAIFILRNVASGEEYKLAKPSILMGRSSSCEITIVKGYPSREHARIVRRKDGLFVEDLHSTNGTWVNNRRIDSATGLSEGDVVTLGEESFVLISQLNPDITVIAGKLTPEANDDACILIADEDDVDSTQLREPFPLPKGWGLDHQDEAFSKPSSSKTRFEMNQLISKAALAKGEIFSAALLFFVAKGSPVVCGLSLEQGQMKWSIGRGQHCNFTINDPCLSDCHALVRYRDGKWLIEDNGSTNGLRVGE